MSTFAKRWVVAPPAPPTLLRHYKGTSLPLAQILYNRGFDNPEAAREFLFPRSFKELKLDPFDLTDMDRAASRINYAIKRREPIAVYGDFDADGVTSTALMMQVLNVLNANVRAYIPHRVDEGYGLNTPALLQLARDGIKLIITVDCGIRSVQEVDDGNAAGLDIIITDHHSVGDELPRAHAVVNPQRDEREDLKNLAGVGVAFMTARAILIDQHRNGNSHKKEEYSQLIDDLMDLVAIGTVADIMPLNVTLNRILVRDGLKIINKNKRVGLQALLTVAGLQPGKVTATSIGFGLAPRINAAGRLESAMLAYELLSEKYKNIAEEYAQGLQRLNTKRQELTRDAQNMVRDQLESDSLLIFARNPTFQQGIVGLVAGRLTEEFYRPCVVLQEGAEESHASCRSIPQFNITHALDKCSDLLVRHGGHAMAAGFTVLNENIPTLRNRLTEIAHKELDGEELIPSLNIDIELELQQLSEDLAAEFKLLEPTGQQNPPPTILTRNLNVVDSRTVGSENAHLKLKLARPNGPPLDAIGFRLGDWLANMPNYIDVVYNLEMNEWNGRETLQLNIQDLRPAEHRAKR